MEIKILGQVRNAAQKGKEGFKKIFFTRHPGTEKWELRFARIKWFGISGVVLFVITVLFMPNEENVQFSKKAQLPDKAVDNPTSRHMDPDSKSKASASALWSTSRVSLGGLGQANQNTSMIVGPKGGNAKTQLRAGFHLPIRIIDKFIVSQEQVPILAELILDSVSDSGLKLPAGTRLYGEASFQKGADRASVQFKQISLPDGEIRPISGIAAGKDGQPGIPGDVHSDGMKNTAGQLLTTFVGGVAAGSMQTNIFGQSAGGLQNGLLYAVSQTAQLKAQAYGQQLQTEREWIEVNAGAEADAILNDSINLQPGGDSHEQR